MVQSSNIHPGYIVGDVQESCITILFKQTNAEKLEKFERNIFSIRNVQRGRELNIHGAMKVKKSSKVPRFPMFG